MQFPAFWGKSSQRKVVRQTAEIRLQAPNDNPEDISVESEEKQAFDLQDSLNVVSYL